MMGATRVDWPEANQRYLMARLRLVRQALSICTNRNEERTVEPSDASSETLLEVLKLATNDLPGPAALDHLCAAFRLSPFERDVLLLCAGVELDSSFAELCAAAQGDSQ